MHEKNYIERVNFSIRKVTYIFGFLLFICGARVVD